MNLSQRQKTMWTFRFILMITIIFLQCLILTGCETESGKMQWCNNMCEPRLVDSYNKVGENFTCQCSEKYPEPQK